MSEKTADDHFRDWEACVFGFGYGTGEPHTLAALLGFFGALDEDRRSYDYRKLEVMLSAPVAWLMINTLCHADILEYGTSARFGWLTRKGERLRDYLGVRDAEGLYHVVGAHDPEYPYCYPEACNCGPNGYDPKAKCPNPFWSDILPP